MLLGRYQDTTRTWLGHYHQGPLDRGLSNGRFPNLDSSVPICPCLSFLGLSRFWRIFPVFLGFLVCPFLVLGPLKVRTHKEHSRKGPRHNQDLSRKRSGKPPVCKPPALASLHIREIQTQLSKPGLGPKGTLWGVEELVPISPEKAPRIGPEKAPIGPAKARFPRKDFSPILSEV